MMDSDTASPLVATLDRIEASVKASKPVLISPSGTLTYGELFERGRRLAALFARRGLRVGDRVIILSRREPEAMTFFFALIRNGIAGVFLDPAAPKVEVEGLVRAAEPAGLVIDADLAAGLGLDLPRLIGRDAPVFRVGADAGGRRPNGAAGGSLFDRLLGRRRTADGDGANGAAAAHAAGGDLLYPSLLEGLAADHPLPDDIADSASAHIMFTSGTTSEPKGVEISHRNVFAHLSTLVRQYGYDGDTRVLIQLPLHHTDGLIQGAMVALFAGAAVYRPGPFSVQGLPDLLDGIYQQRITHFYTVPTVLALIHRLAGAEREAFRTPEFRFVIS
jgi:long-chain acyl-CoA synthetase